MFAAVLKYPGDGQIEFVCNGPPLWLSLLLFSIGALFWFEILF